MRWTLSQPEDRLSVAEAMAEVDQAHWSLGHAGPVLDSWQGMLIKKDLNRSLENVCSTLGEELGRAFETHFGTDTLSWRDIDLRDTVTKVVAQANSRFTVGAPLCRDPDYLRTLLVINDLLITVGSICSGVPHVIRPLVGGVLGIPMTYQVSRVKRWLVPLWRDRVRLAQAARDGRPVDEPQDHVQMMARYAIRERPEEVEDYDLIVRRICAANFGAVHQTSIQVSNLILNILASDPEYGTIKALLDESDRILSEPEPGSDDADEKAPVPSGSPVADSPAADPASANRWTKARVNRMTLADSASRETLRLHSFANRSLIRKVMTRDVTTPDGHSLPRGTIVSFLSWPSHTDPEAHADPLSYDPFRFARQAAEEGKKPPSFVTTSQDYLAFGHGKHACPGRFIVDFELKMMISYILRHYDVRFPDEYEGRRPDNQWLLEATFPPPGARVCVRRKEKELQVGM